LQFQSSTQITINVRAK